MVEMRRWKMEKQSIANKEAKYKRIIKNNDDMYIREGRKEKKRKKRK